MAGRAKKDASEALDKLRDYLRRDRGAMNMLELVIRYLGELRQDKAKLASDNERLMSQIASLTSAAQRLEAQVVEMRGQVSSESSRRRQADSHAAMSRARLGELMAKISPPDVAAGATLNERTLGRIIKDLIRWKPRAPMLVATLEFRGERMNVFDLDDIIPTLTDDEFIGLGKFVVAAVVSLAHGVAFVFDKSDHRNRVRNMSKEFRESSRVGKLMHWMQDWIAPCKEYQKKLHSAQWAAQDIVSGRLVEVPPGILVKE